MAAIALDGLAVALSHLWLLGALPFHSLRLALIHLRAHRTQVELTLGMKLELWALRETIQVIKQMEREVEQMDLAFEVSRRAVLAAFNARMRRLRQRVADSLSADLETGEKDGPDSESPGAPSAARDPRPPGPASGPAWRPGHEVRQGEGKTPLPRPFHRCHRGGSSGSPRHRARNRPTRRLPGASRGNSP